jgi:hypothetical protein
MYSQMVLVCVIIFIIMNVHIPLVGNKIFGPFGSSQIIFFFYWSICTPSAMFVNFHFLLMFDGVI